MESILGKKIKEFRKKKGLTQEELGNLIGITTQAVSKWERGGTPDAEILPSIADTLGVSIDALFGKGENLETLIINELSTLNQKDGFERAFSLCWSIEMGLTGMNSLKNKFTADMLETLDDEYGHEYYSKLLFDKGLVNARLSQNCRHFFLMPEPESGYKEYLSNIDEFSDTFLLLSDKNILKIIFYMYQRKNMAISSTLIAENTGVSKNEVDELMNKLCYYNLAECTKVETEYGEIQSYTFRQECTLIPLLCYARELRVRNMLEFVSLFNREKPLF